MGGNPIFCEHNISQVPKGGCYFTKSSRNLLDTQFVCLQPRRSETVSSPWDIARDWIFQSRVHTPPPLCGENSTMKMWGFFFYILELQPLPPLPLSGPDGGKMVVRGCNPAYELSRFADRLCWCQTNKFNTTCKQYENLNVVCQHRTFKIKFQ